MFKTDVSAEVEVFMRSFGGNHVNLSQGWAENPDMHNELDLLKQQLSIAIDKKRQTVARRILGRYRRLRAAQEDKALAEALSDDMDVLA